MKYAAVIFDLFGTLVDDLSGPEYDAVLTQIAPVLFVKADDFRRLWSDIYFERNTGVFQSVEETIAYICRELGVRAEASALSTAAKIRHDYTERVMMAPRLDTAETLVCLRKRGYRTGLVSDCNPDAPVIWPGTPFAPLVDVSVFSCLVGLKKPDPRIYNLVVERLGVAAKDCLYVGNGGSSELDGALQVGMRPVLVVHGANAPVSYHIDIQWEGDVISSFKEILTLVS